MRGAEVSQANLSKADMTGADLREGKTIMRNKTKHPEDQYGGAAPIPAQFVGSNLSSATLTGADARKANFTDANMQDVNMQGANMQGANMQGVDLSRADLSSADLQKRRFHQRHHGRRQYTAAPRKAARFPLTLTGETVGKDFAEIELTLDELLLTHTSWVASGGRQGRQLDLANTI